MATPIDDMNKQPATIPQGQAQSPVPCSSQVYEAPFPREWQVDILGVTGATPAGMVVFSKNRPPAGIPRPEGSVSVTLGDPDLKALRPILEEILRFLTR